MTVLVQSELKVLWAIHEVVLPGHCVDEAGLHEQAGRRQDDRPPEDDRGVLGASEYATQVQDHKEERQRREVELQQPGVRDPAPLVRVDLAHGREPARVLKHLEDVAHGEAVRKGQAREAQDEPRAQPPLAPVPVH
eukprot:CAMPEP_0168417298 /NCGR_PEP_ID=MMETSP0228-20121227/31182_1 /TAXON_ID=133427 /ORGANISM="Protoceratium reticulatum, Strain CCCM 535 (=CCMP 1889)" /LENGTH=135 /DNA_ID=CAMNT_0008431147 /DNA_START=53 /DNA_END=458 /DNA_ORIENTATION=-